VFIISTNFRYLFLIYNIEVSKSFGHMYYASITYWDCFAIGGISGFLCAKNIFCLKKVPRNNKYFLVLLLVIIVFGKFWSDLIFPPFFNDGHNNLISAFLATALYPIFAILTSFILIFIYNNQNDAIVKFLDTRLLNWLGKRSYGIYMWHIVCQTIIFYYFDFIWRSYSMYIVMPIYLLLVLMFSNLSYKYIEKPFLFPKLKKPAVLSNQLILTTKKLLSEG